MRYRCYKRQKWHYFFLDQCYWVHSALIVGSVVRFDDAAFLKTLFAETNGPVLLAIFMWKNSLALHDFDKATSTFLHLMPGAVTWCWRWFGHERAAALWGAPSSPRLVITAPDGRGGAQGRTGMGKAHLSRRCEDKHSPRVAQLLLRRLCAHSSAS